MGNSAGEDERHISHRRHKTHTLYKRLGENHKLSPAGPNAGFLRAKLTPIYCFGSSPGSELGSASARRRELIGGCFWQDLCSNSSISRGCKQLSAAFSPSAGASPKPPVPWSLTEITKGTEEHLERGTWSLAQAPGTEGTSRQQSLPGGFSFFGASLGLPGCLGDGAGGSGNALEGSPSRNPPTHTLPSLLLLC